MNDATVLRLNTLPVDGPACPVCNDDVETPIWLCPRCGWGIRVLDAPIRVDVPRTGST